MGRLCRHEAKPVRPSTTKAGSPAEAHYIRPGAPCDNLAGPSSVRCGECGP
ncbi:hypothetical protein DPMN_083585 [Dreissena polymorpha]|uniref:Uncharacterized protein n=1 Tax=Dreissena polymorpha TaxID=45954 RepID=A0A9D3YCX9_DREPO|nr:hypothetical protein DPMN_083585 [Dreissena polymorpha]